MGKLSEWFSLALKIMANQRETVVKELKPFFFNNSKSLSETNKSSLYVDTAQRPKKQFSNLKEKKEKVL